MEVFISADLKAFSKTNPSVYETLIESLDLSDDENSFADNGQRSCCSRQSAAARPSAGRSTSAKLITESLPTSARSLQPSDNPMGKASPARAEAALSIKP